MHRMIPAVALALGLAAPLAAQDTTVRSRTRVSGNDARAITLTGCLERGPNSLFTLKNATVSTSDEVTTKSKVETEVDDHGNKVTKSRTKIDRDDSHRAGVAGLKASYELTPQQGVDLGAHVGHQVLITAVALDPKNGDDDVKVKVEEETKINRDKAPDTEVKSRTEATLSPGHEAKVMVLSARTLAPSCTK
ncbi:MAG TPA: hypothetical protein VFB92_04440 [Vicinamibacterales bacterium]|jgi:hypothetical protein|nr:hypothetical protein [Vicinamibacterales bacterium]